MIKEGVEPSRPFGHQILSLARLPVPPQNRNENKKRSKPCFRGKCPPWEDFVHLVWKAIHIPYLHTATGNGFRFSNACFITLAWRSCVRDFPEGKLLYQW